MNYSAHPYQAFGNTSNTGCGAEYKEFLTTYTCDLGLYKDNGVVNFNRVPREMFYDRTNPEGAKFVAKMTDGAPSLKYEVAMSEQARRAGLKAGDVVCAFKPKVQVMDNWGWCSGKCVKAYNQQGNPWNDPSTLQDESVPSDGCYSEIKLSPQLTLDQCLDKNDSGKTDPWIYYNKQIIVIP